MRTCAHCLLICFPLSCPCTPVVSRHGSAPHHAAQEYTIHQCRHRIAHATPRAVLAHSPSPTYRILQSHAYHCRRQILACRALLRARSAHLHTLIASAEQAHPCRHRVLACHAPLLACGANLRTAQDARYVGLLPAAALPRVARPAGHDLPDALFRVLLREHLLRPVRTRDLGHAHCVAAAQVAADAAPVYFLLFGPCSVHAAKVRRKANRR